MDTPWNAFAHDDQALVCTLWVDCIADVFDPQENHIRRFVRLGGKSREWKGVAINHGGDARNNLERAIRLRKPVFGYEAEPQPGPLERGERKVKHFYLNRVHQLRGWIGTRLLDLEERLHIEDAFLRAGIHNDSDHNFRATLFELVETTAELPSASRDEETDTPENENENDTVNEEVGGNLSTDEYARLALPLLVAHVLQQKDDVLVPITYLRLAELLDRRNRHGEPWARGLGHILGRATALIERAGTLWPECPPFLTSVVVLSVGPDAGLPGIGVGEQWPSYESLSREDKQAKVWAEYRRILEFGSRWNEILRLVNLPTVEPTSGSAQNYTGTGGWAGGESEAHKALKRFIFENPEICGAPKDGFAQEEFALRSGDEIDVMFKSDRVWFGVEVKSHVSDGKLDDYERGLYQVVKYRAVLEAQARIDRPEDPPEVHVLLALESKLPDNYRELAATLGVQYLEGISPDNERDTDVRQPEADSLRPAHKKPPGELHPGLTTT
ncbi:hypothetical protein PQR21_34685 [Paraburkholderia nemoris]|uniref:hypothetical protein n=1 Tax=Paraburkholderia nemoris TaxID=2793076 RepID=UPI0038B8C7E9